MSLTIAMLTSLVVTAVPAMALSQPTVSLSGTTISSGGVYTITTTAGANLSLATAAQYIQVVFPAGTNFGNITNAAGAANATDSSVWIQVLAGINGGPIANVGTTFNKTADGAAVPTLNITIPAGGIGAGSLVGITVGNSTSNVTNPATAGNYTLTVATLAGATVIEAAQTSTSFEIKNPTISALPGVVSVFNTAGVQMSQSNNISASLATVTSTGWSLTLTAGTYTDNLNTTGLANSTTIKAAPGVAASAAIIKSTVTINSSAVTLDSVTIQGVLVIDGAANQTVIKNSSVSRSSSTTGAKTLITYNSTGANAVASVTNTTIDTTSGAVDDTAGVNVNVGANQGITFTGCTFKGDAGDDLLLIAGGNVTVPIAVNNCSFLAESTSAIPFGITVSSGFAAITNSTLTGLDRALQTSGTSNATVQTSTITGSGNPVAALTAGGAIVAGGTSTLILLNNTISNSAAANYALNVNGANVTARFNAITGNTLNVNQQSGTANASLNWWGSADGPAASSLNATTAANLVTTPVLPMAVTNPALGFVTDTLNAQTTAGVVVTTGNNTGALGIVGAAKYASNPQAIAPTGTPIAYYDVFLGNVGAGSSVTIKFYGAVTDNTKVYYGGGLNGAWSLASNQGVNTASGFAFITVNAGSAPAISDMTGTPFVLTNIVPPPAAPVLTGPISGATGVPTNTGFSWTPVTGATSYDFQISTGPTFATLVVPAASTAGNVYGGVALAANTTYFWRVRSVTGTLVSAYATSTFTTAAPAAAAVAPNITVQAPPAAVVNVAPPTVNVAAPPAAVINVAPPTVNVATPPAPVVNVSIPPAAPLVPAYLLWTIILIGAVLVIALIVLIVRTRRVA